MRNKNSGTKIFVGLLVLAAGVLAYFKFFKKKKPKMKGSVDTGPAVKFHENTDDQLDLNQIEIPSNAFIKMAPISPAQLQVISDLKGYNSASPEYGGPRVVLPPAPIDYNILLENADAFIKSPY